MAQAGQRVVLAQEAQPQRARGCPGRLDLLGLPLGAEGGGQPVVAPHGPRLQLQEARERVVGAVLLVGQLGLAPDGVAQGAQTLGRAVYALRGARLQRLQLAEVGAGASFRGPLLARLHLARDPASRAQPAEPSRARGWSASSSKGLTAQPAEPSRARDWSASASKGLTAPAQSRSASRGCSLGPRLRLLVERLTSGVGSAP